MNLVELPALHTKWHVRLHLSVCVCVCVLLQHAHFLNGAAAIAAAVAAVAVAGKLLDTNETKRTEPIRTDMHALTRQVK